MAAQDNGRAQCETTTEASRVIATAMHRDDVRDPGAPGGPAGVDRHRELMAVGERDSMPTEGAFQPPGARRRYGPLQVEVQIGRASCRGGVRRTGGWGGLKGR